MGKVPLEVAAPPVDWRSMTRERKKAWARTIVESTRAVIEAEADDEDHS